MVTAQKSFEQLLIVSREYSDVLYRVARLKWQQASQSKTGDQTELQLGIQDEVVSLLSEYLQRRSNDVKVRIFFATIFCETNQYKICKQQINLVLKLAPNNKGALDLQQNFTAKLSVI